MKETIRRLNEEYRLDLSEEEIELVTNQAEAGKRLLQQLYEVDLTGVMPILKVDRKVKK